MSAKSISIQKADLGYRRQGADITVLRRVQLDLYEGELVGMVGVNGVGKSTLLKSMCGLLPVLNGHIEINGKESSELSLQEIAKLVAVVLTEKIAGFNLTTYDLVASGQMPYTNSFHQLKSQHRHAIDKAIDICDLRAHVDKQLHELSDGLFQKAAIARAIAQQTPVMLLDEPSAFLDYASKHKLFQLLQELCRENKKTIVVSSHDLDLVMKYCTKILVVTAKGLEMIPAQEAKDHPAFLEIGGGYI